MMLHPTVAELTKDKINRYELAIATAKCARAINNEYIKQKELADKAALAGKDSEFVVTVDRELADVKAVRVAIDRIYSGEYMIVRTDGNAEEKAEATENAETAEAAEAAETEKAE